MIRSITPLTAAKKSEQLTHQAQKLVAQTFYGTLMKQMHDSPFKSQIMDGGRGGQAFQPLMDQHLIDRMSKSSSKKTGKLIHSVVHRLERNNVSRNRPTGVSAASPSSGDSTQEDGKPSDGSPRKRNMPSLPSLRQNRVEQNPLREMRSHVTPGLRA